MKIQTDKLSLTRYLSALLVSIIIHFGYNYIEGSDNFDSNAVFMLIMGVAFGVILQRSRFCFFCILRDLIEYKNGKPLAGLITALIIGGMGYLVFFGAWVTDPSAGHLPQDAHVAPVSWHLLAGGLLFGWGMALSGSCISAHFYRIGEGSVVAPFALAGTVVGFIPGYLVWNTLYTSTISSASIPWLPDSVGYGGAFIIQTFVLLAILLWLLIKFPSSEQTDNRSSEPYTLRHIAENVFIQRWPTWIGGVGVGLIAIFAYFRVEPLGVTAELGRISRDAGNSFDVIPTRLEGLDGLAGCTVQSAPAILSTNGVFIAALVAGALFSALIAGQFKPRLVRFAKIGKGFGGGILLGFGAMISLGCTIGTTLSGIMAFAVSGWVFTLAMVAGVWSGIKMNWHR